MWRIIRNENLFSECYIKIIHIKSIKQEYIYRFRASLRFGGSEVVAVMTVANLKSKLLLDVVVSDNEFDVVALE